MSAVESCNRMRKVPYTDREAAAQHGLVRLLPRAGNKTFAMLGSASFARWESVMPGSVSDSYSARVCRCQHFDSVHDNLGKCEGERCKCQKFDEMPFDESEVGKATNELIDGFQKGAQ